MGLFWIGLGAEIGPTEARCFGERGILLLRRIGIAQSWGKARIKCRVVNVDT